MRRLITYLMDMATSWLREMKQALHEAHLSELDWSEYRKPKSLRHRWWRQNY